MGKKRKKQRRKLAATIEEWLQDAAIDERELILVGIGVMAHDVTKNKKGKRFKKSLRMGRKLAAIGLPSLSAPRAVSATVTSTNGDTGSEPPLIAYAPLGGGWYAIEVDGVVVRHLQGEEDAAAAVAELLAKYAALDPDEQQKRETVLAHSGGGWYDIKVRGVPVDRVRGREDAEDRFAEIASG